MLNKLSPSYISELVCTRISHDIIGNIGAVSNAVELLEDDDPESLADVKPILEWSSQVLSARLKFFRLAFGLSNASIKNIEELKDIVSNYAKTIGNRNFPVKLSLNIKTPELYKIVLLGVMSLADVFIKGGSFDVEETPEGINFIAGTPNSLSVSKLEAIKMVLAGNMLEENPAQVAPIAYLMGLLENTGVNINLDFTDSQASLKIG